MPLDNQTLAQLMTALAETPQFQFLDQLMREQTAPQMGAEEPGFEGEPAVPEATGEMPGAGMEPEAPTATDAAVGPGEGDDLADVQDMLVDEEGYGEEPMAAEEPGPEAAPAEEEEPTEKNALPALLPAAAAAAPAAAGGGMSALTAGSLGAGAGLAGGSMMGKKRHSEAAGGNGQVDRYSVLAASHNRLVQEHGNLQARVQQLLAEKSDAERIAVLQSINARHPGFLDMETEAAAVLYSQGSTMDDESFNAHVASVEKYALRVDQMARAERPDLPQGAVAPPPQDAQAEKYQASRSRLAVRIHTDKASKGEQITWDEARALADEQLKTPQA